MKQIIFLLIVLLLFGCTTQQHTQVSSMKEQLIITENTVGTIGNYSIGVANIWEREGKLTGIVSIWDQADPEHSQSFTVGKGDSFTYNSVKYTITEIKPSDTFGSVTVEIG